jgi:hypothetical protein
MTGPSAPALSFSLLVLCSVNYQLGCDLAGTSSQNSSDAGDPATSDGGPGDAGDSGTPDAGDSGTPDAGDGGTVDAGALVIALDSTSSSYAQASPLTWTHTVGASATNVVLLVGVTLGSGQITDATSVTYNGLPLTRAVSRVGNPVVASMWYLVGPPPGAHPVVVTFNGNPDTAAGAISLAGVDQITPIATTSGGTQSGGAVTQSITTQFPNSWVVDAMALIVPGATPSAQQTLRWQLDAGIGTGQGSDLVTTSPGVYTSTWTGPGAGDQSAIVLVEVKP